MQKLMVLFTSVMLLCISLKAFAQDDRRKDREIKKQEEYQDLLQLIETGQYAFRGIRANPQSAPQIDLTTRDNFLRIDKGNAEADMPYFGRAYSGGYSGGEGGVKFDGPMESYQVDKNDKKRRITIKFKVKGTYDTYTCTLTGSGIENASFSVISTKRQAISYTGRISELKNGALKENR